MVNELKLHIFENMFESLAETVKEKFSWIQNIPIPGQSQKKTQTSFPGFLMPDMTQEIPILKKYCGNDDNQIDNYLCTSLSNHLSLAANYSKYKDSPCFFAVFGISSHPRYTKPVKISFIFETNIFRCPPNHLPSQRIPIKPHLIPNHLILLKSFL